MGADRDAARCSPPTSRSASSNGEFLASGSTTWCFFEEGAFDPDGELTQPKQLSINKIGHAQHDLDDEFERFAYQPALAEVAADIGLVDPLALQTMYIFKQPLIGGEVGCHQDATFLYTDPMTVTGFWFAIEDATLDNGCLWAAPGGHRGPLRQLFKRTEAGRRHRVRAARRHPTAGAATCRRRLVPLRGTGRHDGGAARPAPALERGQHVADQPARVLPALHLRSRRLSRLELAAASRRTCHFAGLG